MLRTTEHRKNPWSYLPVKEVPLEEELDLLSISLHLQLKILNKVYETKNKE